MCGETPSELQKFGWMSLKAMSTWPGIFPWRWVIIFITGASYRWFVLIRWIDGFSGLMWYAVPSQYFIHIISDNTNNYLCVVINNIIIFLFKNVSIFVSIWNKAGKGSIIQRTVLKSGFKDTRPSSTQFRYCFKHFKGLHLLWNF